nr:YHYH domain-containing protein [Clostridium sp. AM58-1XD]
MALCLSTAAAGISISPAFVMESEAHSGRTDSNGGHHDYKNKSGLGDYHYHHGYGPHLHPNGVCPYTSGTGSSSGSVQNSPVGGGSSSGTASSNKWFCDDYKGCCSYIFDSSYYAEKYPELAETFGYDSDKLYSHFVSNGMSEGRQGCSTFNVQSIRTIILTYPPYTATTFHAITNTICLPAIPKAVRHTDLNIRRTTKRVLQKGKKHCH